MCAYWCSGNFLGGLDRGLLHFTLPCTGGLAGTFSSRFQFTNSAYSLYSAALTHVWSVSGVQVPSEQAW